MLAVFQRRVSQAKVLKISKELCMTTLHKIGIAA
jgi:hypothetical protein